MVPHPRAVDNNTAAAVIIHARSGTSKQGEIDDLVIAQCMAQRKVTSAMTMPLKYRVDTGSHEAQKPAIGRIN
jgi:hypothetical protein